MPKWPGKGSAFEGVKNLHHLWPVHPFWDGETWPPPEIPVLYEPVQLEPSHPAFDYLNNRMHDAGVVDFSTPELHKDCGSRVSGPEDVSRQSPVASRGAECARLVLNDHG